MRVCVSDVLQVLEVPGASEPEEKKPPSTAQLPQLDPLIFGDSVEVPVINLRRFKHRLDLLSAEQHQLIKKKNKKRRREKEEIRKMQEFETLWEQRERRSRVQEDMRQAAAMAQQEEEPLTDIATKATVALAATTVAVQPATVTRGPYANWRTMEASNLLPHVYSKKMKLVTSAKVRGTLTRSSVVSSLYFHLLLLLLLLLPSSSSSSSSHFIIFSG